MPHRVRSATTRRRMLRAVERLDGPAFSVNEAAEVWDLSPEETDELLRELNRVGLAQPKLGSSTKIWWITKLAHYDLDCRRL